MLRFNWGHVTTVVMASGAGSTFAAIDDNCKRIDIKAVLCDNPNAGVIERAYKRGLPTIIQLHDHMRETIGMLEPQLIILAGYMRILDSDFVDQYYGRIINIHPSLLPKYKGLHTHRRALEAKDEYHGSTIHVVTPELDSGPIIQQRKFKINHGESLQTLEAQVHELEHQMYPEVIDAIADGRVQLPERDDEPVLWLGPNSKWREPTRALQ